MIFAVFDVLLTVNMCINYSFFYIYSNYQVTLTVISWHFYLFGPIIHSY